jgi:protein-S-isoprenylcysteine O-methyltransferase Ste14
MWNTYGFKPPMLLLLILAGMPLAHLVLPIAPVLPFPWSLAGLGLVTGGIALNLVADRLFKESDCMSACRGPDELLTGGPYALSRNPMYLGFALLLIGIALLLGSLGPLLLAAGFVPLTERLFIRCEEALLSSRHGDAWTAYAARVRRWL